MEEIWKETGDMNGVEVSNTGRVRFPDSKKELKATDSGSGEPHKEVRVMNDGKTIRKYVHELVAETFGNKPSDKPLVNHKDRDKSNNNVNNLEFMDKSENTRYK